MTVEALLSDRAVTAEFFPSTRSLGVAAETGSSAGLGSRPCR